jgi:signal transduction histidine kinase
VLLSREAMVIHADRNGSTLPGSFFDRYQAREFALVPLITRDDVIGIMLVDNLVTQARIEEQDLNRLKLFANSAASAIERGRLLQSLEKRLHELTLANRELKESRDRLVKTERLSAIGEVAASVAHEIRNPLVAIGGFARTVFQSLPEEDRNKNKVKVIVEETDRLERILSGLLEFSRPALPRFTDVDLNGLVLQTVHFMDAEIDDDLVHITYDLDAELPRVWADTQQMRQVLLNLIRNAVQAMPNGGTVTFRTDVQRQEVRLSIEDSGPGIPPDQTERIFDAFFTTKPTGSGLGLAICTQLVRNHNGRISVESGRTLGAKFVISLPMAQESA